MPVWPPASTMNQADAGRPGSSYFPHFDAQNHLDFVSGTTIRQLTTIRPVRPVVLNPTAILNTLKALKHSQYRPIESASLGVGPKHLKFLDDSDTLSSLRVPSTNTTSLSVKLETEPDAWAATSHFQLICSCGLLNPKFIFTETPLHLGPA